MDVHGLEARLGEGVGHLDMRVDALLSQDGDLGSREMDRRGVDSRSPNGGLNALWEKDVQARVCRIANGCVFQIGAGGVVTQLADLPAHVVPDLVQVLQLRAEH